jgi:hypothetical protein
MKRAVLISCAALLPVTGVAGFAGAAEGPQSYTVAMTGEEETPVPGPKGATGTITMNIDSAAGQLCYSGLTYEGPGKADQGHIHKGAKGMAGPVAINLGLLEEGKDACVTADKKALDAVLADPGGHYVNLHTAEYPGGAVRGQVSAG